MGDRLELGCGCCVDDFLKDREVEAFAGPGNEFFEVDLADRANGVKLVEIVSMGWGWLGL